MGKKNSQEAKNSSKQGRNKVKCERYRFKKGGGPVVGSKHPKGIGRSGRKKENGFSMGAGEGTDHQPIESCPHLAQELFELGKRGVGVKAIRASESAPELARHLRPSLRSRVLVLQKRGE